MQWFNDDDDDVDVHTYLENEMKCCIKTYLLTNKHIINIF